MDRWICLFNCWKTNTCSFYRLPTWLKTDPMKRISIFGMLGLIFALTSQHVAAQQILMDRGTRVAELWCFPLLDDPDTYVYLPSESRLTWDPEHELPQFSLLRYVINRPDESAGVGSAITSADGGALLNFLIEYYTPEEQVDAAQSALQERMDNDDIVLRGPIVFDQGRYALVSSILRDQASEQKVEVLTTGSAPVLEGSRIAFSFELDPEKSKLLMESLTTATSDLSVVFDLSFSGLTDNYEATMEVDWNQVYQSQDFSAGGSVYFVGADVELGFEKLYRQQAIKLDVKGESPNMDGLLQTVYNKLLDLLFAPVRPEAIPADQRGGLMDALGAALSPNGALGSRNTTGFGLNVAYRMKDYRSEGTSRLQFSGAQTVERHHFISFNAGDLFNQYGEDERMFKTVPLWDPDFQQREVIVTMDGTLENAFEDMLNSVTLVLHKEHQNGQESSHQIVVMPQHFESGAAPLNWVYGSHQDTNRLEWLNYRFHTIWQFQGGGQYETLWDTISTAVVNLYTPFSTRSIDLEGDLEYLVESGVRAVLVELTYDFFGMPQRVKQTIRMSDNLADKGFRITLPNDSPEVSYKLTYIMREGRPLSAKGIDEFGLIFIDELPEPSTDME
ncbi:hypothetical protein [Pontibacter sp. G13]|uniref:hypothetical protein n=1 Tax=Pontibacter sp. G13 TaxID=3074898 RepID=UPI00288BEFE5|nr:hypothetical protein [Pontibacter sp. G13]WNJ19645.1 hypothetical protein RJD25_04095 [Pontibacter sp. G13]